MYLCKLVLNLKGRPTSRPQRSMLLLDYLRQLKLLVEQFRTQLNIPRRHANIANRLVSVVRHNSTARVKGDIETITTAVSRLWEIRTGNSVSCSRNITGQYNICANLS